MSGSAAASVSPVVLVVQALPSSSGGATARYLMPVHARVSTGAFTTARDLRRAVPGIPFHFAYPNICSSTSGKRLPACVRGLTSADYSAATRQPLPGWPVMVANNDWWLEESRIDRIAPYWAEVSLRSAERALHDQVGLGRPPWLDSSYYQHSVLRI